ncbi:uncharacterized protein LOC131588547 isoform X1 [Poecile atricapillus]|uniref:uncharacterized protein LOC131588547 isoform X1 n=1 Tax=Poecile atricapillus TaxID=48891 RepID=UPI002739948A|nr:uncharacterized protein LOC131588547 isoform X1 [Poecile atricapillus]XP_058713453.1 uncharacterized protein LOC131588547 isoform X1 [Poecile atricapillus]
MGNAVLALEKATIEALLRMSQNVGTPLDRTLLTDVLFWAKRHRLIIETADVFTNAAWKRVGEDLWEAIQSGSKEAQALAKTYRQVRLMIEQLSVEAEIEATVKGVYAAAEGKAAEKSSNKQPGSENDCDRSNENIPTPHMVAAPAHKGPYDDLIPPWDGNSQVPQTSSPVNPSMPPFVPLLPMEVDPVSAPLSPDSDTESEALKTLLSQQARVMTQLLQEVQCLDRDAKSTTIKQAYKKAHNAIVSGLKNIENQLGDVNDSVPGPSPLTPKQPSPGSSQSLSLSKRKALLNYMKDGEWSVEEADNYLCSKYGTVARIMPEEKREIREWQQRYSPHVQAKQDPRSTRDNTFWLPAKWVKPWILKQKPEDAGGGDNNLPQ